MGKSQTEALPSEYCEVNTVGRGLRFSCNDQTVEVTKLFIIWHHQQNFQTKIRCFFNYLLLCLCKAVIGLWALRENNALQFSHNKPIRARVI